MNITAAEILNHCKAVVEGRIPQPLPFWVEASLGGDGFYSIYPSKPSEDSPFPFDLISVKPYSLSFSAQIAARILGLDRPAPVVELEWHSVAEDRGHNTMFNDYISAGYCGDEEVGFFVYVSANNNTYSESLPISTTEAQARAWCVRRITEITTPTPKQ